MLTDKNPLHKTLTPFIVSLAFFMESLDTTIINTAIPAMSRSLQVNPIDLKIALISYLLSLAIFIPISGWIADKWGPKRVLLIAISIFTFASFWCGFSSTLLELVAARSLQGLGGALMLPVGRLIIVQMYPRHELINTMSKVVIVGALGIMLGPVLGGIITHYFSWNWIFWINIPVGVFNLLLVYFVLVDRAPKKVPPLDKIGFVLFGLGLAGLTLSFSLLSESNYDIRHAGGLLALSIFLLFLYTKHSRRRKHPIVNVALFHYRTFNVSVCGNLLGRLGFGGTPFLLPLLFQIGLGYSPQTSGCIMAPIALGVILIKPFTLSLLRRFGYKNLLIANTILVAIGICSFGLITKATPIYLIMLLTFSYGFLVAMQYSGMNSLAYIEIQDDHLSAATSIMSTLQQLTQSLGVAIAAILIRHFSITNTPYSSTVFQYTFAGMSILTLLSVSIFLRLRADDGRKLTQLPAS